MVWGCMSSAGVGMLHFIDGTVDGGAYVEILSTRLLPSLERLHPDGDCLFQQDGAPCHTSKVAQRWFASHRLHLLPWAPSSPDMSPIENVWGMMKKKIRKERPRTKEELMAALRRIWDNITPARCKELVSTMHNRVQALLNAKGGLQSTNRAQ
jgi:transposase